MWIRMVCWRLKIVVYCVMSVFGCKGIIGNKVMSSIDNIKCGVEGKIMIHQKYHLGLYDNSLPH